MTTLILVLVVVVTFAKQPPLHGHEKKKLEDKQQQQSWWWKARGIAVSLFAPVNYMSRPNDAFFLGLKNLTASYVVIIEASTQQQQHARSSHTASSE